MSPIDIASADPAPPAVRELIAQLDAYQADLYPAESNHLLPLKALQQPNVTFLVVRVGGELASCARSWTAAITRKSSECSCCRPFAA